MVVVDNRFLGDKDITTFTAKYACEKAKAGQLPWAWSAGIREPAEAGFLRRRSKSEVGRRHHVSAYWWGLTVSGGGDWPVVPCGHRLVDVDSTTGVRCVTDGTWRCKPRKMSSYIRTAAGNTVQRTIRHYWSGIICAGVWARRVVVTTIPARKASSFHWRWNVSTGNAL